MDDDWWLQGSLSMANANLAAVRNSAAVFLEGLSACTSDRRERWTLEWITVGDRYHASAEAAFENNLRDLAIELWLSALTAFEVARQLACSENPAGVNVSNAIERSFTALRSCAPQQVERVEIELFDRVYSVGYFCPTAHHERPGPVAIVISDEESSPEAVVARLLPAVNNRILSLMVVSGEDVSKHRMLKPEAFLAIWLDYLQCRPDVDADRMAVDGEGMAASYATCIAASDRRVAAAVCDGGLWASLRHRANVAWMTGVWDLVSESARTSSLPLVHRIPCPIFIVVGGRGPLDEQNALEFKAGCKLAGWDCSVVVSQVAGEVENFVINDDLTLDWLEQKLQLRR
ncbi:hypothetical protein TSA1_21485 [Bradyrhizobium nitroreducens]|uniref:Alpha/beta hydrolase n=2 Tax=Bradyrhizobium nitroreducens TaxID=709803 RepID=A0A2M6UES0_9BRAD|nr:hypothetical protein TSA1_21485 [Bradyrhizobium nitroreducens]